MYKLLSHGYLAAIYNFCHKNVFTHKERSLHFRRLYHAFYRISCNFPLFCIPEYMRKNITRICIALTVCISAMAFAQTNEREENDFERQQAARKYFNDLRTSGEEKDIAKINENAYKAFKNVGNIVAFKGLTIPAWQQIAGDLDGIASGRSKNCAFAGLDTVYLATAGGGIWKTTNINATQPSWVCVTDKLPSNAFGGVACDPNNSNVVYAGTGEYVTDGYKDPAGDGVFKSTDGGLNWFKILSKDTLGAVCVQIVLDPNNADIVYIATGSAKSGARSGLLKSTDAGKTWVSTALTAAPISLVINAQETNRLYVGGTNKVWISRDAGGTWTSTTLPNSTGAGRIALSISPSSPNVVYASVAKSGMPTQSTIGLYVTTDHGDTWRNFVNQPTANWCGSQGYYDNGIAVHPTQPKIVFLGGINIFKTIDSGKNFTQVTFNQEGQTPYSHADVQKMAFNGTTLFANTDGGLTMGKGYGSSWTTGINKGINTLEFVGADADPAFTFVIGGCQDNNTSIALIGAKSWDRTRGGDGGRTFVARNDPSICFSTYVYGQMYKSQDGGRTWDDINTPFTGSSLSQFYINYDLDANASIGIAGAYGGLYMTTAGGEDKWGTLTSSAIKNATSCHVWPDDATFMWAGVGGGVYRTVDQGATWTKTTISGSAAITGIISDPGNNLNLWVCSQGTGGTNKHVYKSTDGGAKYTALLNFPDSLGCNAIARQQINGKDRIIVGTDKGVLYTENDGQIWNALADGMPIVTVTTLKIRGANQDKLLASMYGRGCMWLDLAQLSVSTGPMTSDASTFELSPITPNPIRGDKASLGLTLSKPAIVTVTLFDILGKEVKVLEKKMMEIGKSSLEFSTQGLASGSYVIVATSNGTSKTQKIIVE